MRGNCGNARPDPRIFLVKRGWRDEEDGSTQELEGYKADTGLSHRKDLEPFLIIAKLTKGERNSGSDAARGAPAGQRAVVCAEGVLHRTAVAS